MDCGLIAILVLRALWAQEPLPTEMHDLSWGASNRWFVTHPMSHLRVELETPIGPLPFVLTVWHDFRFNPDEPDEPEAFDVEHWNAGRGQPHFPATVRVGMESVAFKFHIRGGGSAGSSRAWLRTEEGALVLAGYGSGSCTSPSALPRQFLREGTWENLRLSVVQVATADERFTPVDDAGPPGDFPRHWVISVDDAYWGVMLMQKPVGALAVADVIGPDGKASRCEGRIDGDDARVSFFDGSRAALIHARKQTDGTLLGEWWDSEWGWVSWTAERKR